MLDTREEQKCQGELKEGEMKKQRREGERHGGRPDPNRQTDRQTVRENPPVLGRAERLLGREEATTGL